MGILSENKQYFVVLDGLRGVAALLVGWLHASQLFSLSYKPAHAYLAVDFFFCLSGFVIAYAYDKKLDEGMRFTDFAIKRLIRLYPMIFCGVLLGSTVWLFGGGGGGKVVVVTAAALALLPLGLLFHDQAYPPNNPIWSLFFELVANAVYGIERRTGRVNATFAIFFLAASGVALILVGHGEHSLEAVGFASVSTFIAGFVRVTFPFFAGVLIYRYGCFKLRISVPSLAIAVALIAILAAPVFRWSWRYDVLAVIVFFPAIVILGASATGAGQMSKLWTLLGKLSYPFYVIHQPILRAAMHVNKFTHLPSAVVAALPAVGILAAAASAYVIMKIYDEPVRRWLTARRGDNIRTPSVDGGAGLGRHQAAKSPSGSLSSRRRSF